MKPAVFLDRDGTLIVDRGYVHRVEDLAFIDGAVDAIAALNRQGWLVIVVTNQSGVARGYYSETDVERFHRAMRAELAKAGARVDAFYHCPYHPTAGLGRYRRDSPMRKPATGMFVRACDDYAIDVEASWMVGDKLDDMRFARAAGLRGILVQTGQGSDEVGTFDQPPWFATAESIVDACRNITGTTA